MRAQRGDHIVLAGERVGEPTRDGIVLEVRGEDGRAPFVVRWSDGHEGVIYPAPGTGLRVYPAGEAPPGGGTDAGESRRPTHEWTVRVSIYEAGDETTAQVALVTDSPRVSAAATGESHRSPEDPRVPRIGDEVAVARALRHLAEQLLEVANHEVEEVTGEEDVSIRAR